MVSRTASMKVMLVDDEQLALEDLQTLIPWESYGCEVVATATNGKKALELFERCHPHLMIVDVRMPIMDGIELLRQLSTQYAEAYPKVILLTAYKDFGYAQKAIEYRVSNYLLKHTIDESTLLGEVVKLRREWALEQSRSRYIHRQRLKSMLSGREPWPSPAARGATRPVGLIVFEEDRPFTAQPYWTEPDRSVAADFIEELDWETLGVAGDIDVAEGPGGQCCVVVTFRETHSQRMIHESMQSIASFVLKRYASARGATLSAAMSQAYGAHALPELHREASRALRYKWFIGRSTYIDTTQMRHRTSEETPKAAELDAQLKAVTEWAANGEVERAAQTIRKLFQNVERPVWNLAALYKTAGGLLDALERLDGENGGFAASTSGPSVAEELRNGGLYGVHEIRDWFLARFAERASGRGPLVSSRYSFKTNQAIDYIRKHYREDLNVRSVSLALHISPSYLHQLFKKEVGSTFLEYLTDYRIKVAKELLLDDRYKIYEIAEMTGYNTSQYFSQVFQRVTGLSPQAFKNRSTERRSHEN